MKIIKPAFFGILSVALILGWPQLIVHAHEEDVIPAIQVRGEGRVETIPDQAVVSVGVSSEDKSLEKAYRDNTVKMNAVISTVKEAGIAPKDVQTSSFYVHPVYAQDEQGRTLLGVPVSFRVSQDISVGIRDLAKTGPLLDRLMAQGTNVLDGLRFTSSRLEELKKEAKSLAAKDARANAALLAQSLGVKLGKLLKVNDEFLGPYPVETRSFAMMAAQPGVAADPQIEAGSLEVIAACYIEYAISQ